MKNAHTLLIATAAGITAGCAVAAAALAPFDSNRAGSAAGFVWLGGLAAAAAVVCGAAIADAAQGPAVKRARH